MRVVVDTNVVVSAALKNRDPEFVLLLITDRPEFEWVATQEILDEYLEVLARPQFALSEAVVLRNYWGRALRRWFSDKRLRTRRLTCERVLVMQASQHRFREHERIVRQSMSGF